ncbi:MAG: response regulator [Proteobacteria bacterium]|nr:response regulator [Pseudomonadota bacterium]
MRILVVEDDPMLGKAIKNALENENNVVDLVTDGESCESALATASFDIVILDINLPDKSGLEVLRKLRTEKNLVPVLVLSARSSISQKIEGLDFGADDYLAKPFELSELLARIRSLVRRSKGIAAPILSYEDLELNPAKHSVSKAGMLLEISPKEFAILKTLLENLGKVVSKSRLENLLYSWDNAIESNAIEVHIHHLRKKIGQNFIKNIRGVGYLVG